LADYCIVDDVKSSLQVDLAETKYDTKLADCVVDGSALVDSELLKHGLIVPPVVPQLIKVAAKFFAAWEFRRFSDPVGAEAFWVEAQRFLDSYVESSNIAYVGSV
jgi:hypothetical protein